jgi:hypothetical protein
MKEIEALLKKFLDILPFAPYRRILSKEYWIKRIHWC